MKNKRGISVLISAVLLIALAIALAVIVSSIVLKKARDFNPDEFAQESVFCESVGLGYTVDDPSSLDIRSEGGVDLLEGITLVNRGSFSIYRLTVNAPGTLSRDYLIYNDDGFISPETGNNKYNVIIQIDKSNPDKEIRLVPVVRDQEKNQFVRCTDRQLILNYGQVCMEIRGDPDC